MPKDRGRPQEKSSRGKKGGKDVISPRDDDRLRREASSLRRKQQHEQKRKQKKVPEVRRGSRGDGRKGRKADPPDDPPRKQKKGRDGRRRMPEEEALGARSGAEPAASPFSPPSARDKTPEPTQQVWQRPPHDELLHRLNGEKCFDGEIALSVKSDIVFGRTAEGLQVPLKVVPAKMKGAPRVKGKQWEKSQQWVEADAGTSTTVFGVGTISQGGEGMQVEDVDSQDEEAALSIEVRYSTSTDADSWSKPPIADKRRKMYLGKREVFDEGVRARYLRVGYGDPHARHQPKLPLVHIGLLVPDNELIPVSMVRSMLEVLECVQLDNDDLSVENEELRAQVLQAREQLRCCSVM